MSFAGDFSSSRSLIRLAQTERVKRLLDKARTISGDDHTVLLATRPAPDVPAQVPLCVVAIDGSYVELPVKTGYPGAHIGYVTVAGVYLKLSDLERLDEDRPIDPVQFRKTEEAATIDAALPGSNVVTREHLASRSAFREALFEVLHETTVLEDDGNTLLDTFKGLLSLKPQSRPQKCPKDGCEHEFVITSQTSGCTCEKQCRIYPTDALRIHERFNDLGSNGEAFGLVAQVWERVLLVHLLKCFERLDWLRTVGQLVFFLDGPLAVFGPPAWLSAAISTELKRMNMKVRGVTGNDMMIVGIETSGSFVTHFEDIDQSERPGERRFKPRSYLLLTDEYIKRRIVLSDSIKRYGADTYFGRKFFYKTSSGARIVAGVPFLSAEQDTLDDDDISLYPQFAAICGILDRLVSARVPNAISPIISAHAHAAIPIRLGKKVLQQLARTMMEHGQ